MKYLILVITLLLVFPTYSQKVKTLSTSYSLKSKEIKDLDSDYVGYKKSLKIKMDSINPALQKIVYTFKDFVWYSETPEGLAKLFPGIEKVNQDSSNNNNKGTGNSTDSSNSIVKTPEPIIKRLDSINNIITITKKTLSKTGDINTEILIATLKQIIQIIQWELPKKDSISGTDIINTLSFQMDSLNNTYQLELDHIKLKGLPSDYTQETIEYLTQLKMNQEKLIGIKPTILNGTKAIIYGLKKPNNSDISKLHLPKKEAVTVNIYVIDRFSQKDTLSTFNTDIYITGKCKLDFSVGIGGNSLIDPVFYIAHKDSVPFIETEDKREIDLTAYSLLHLNIRVNSMISAGPLTGISISIIDAKPSYLIGGGLTLGKEKTMSISGGASFGELKLLSNSISSDGYNVDKPLDSDISEIPTYKKMSAGYFFAVTYNFGRVKK